MSDTNGAPDGAAEHISASEAGQGASQEAVSTRDSVAAAFAKLEQGNEQPNQSAAPQKPVTADARARDEQGRFAQRQAGDQQPAKAAGAQPEGTREPEADPNAQPARGGPPPGWSPASKEAFASLPDSVKADIAKREQEVNAGLSELREYRDLRPYRDMAQRSGTNLPAVMANLTKMEDMLGKDPVNAIGALSEMYGFDIRQAVTGLAQALGMQVGQAPAGEGQPQPAAQPMVLPPEIRQALARLDGLERHISGQNTATINGAIEAFAADPQNEFFENVGDEICRIIASDVDRYRSMPPKEAVKEAYDQAVWMNPATRDVLIKRQSEAAGRANAERMQATAHQARQAAKGLSGTPVNGATPGSKPPTPQSTRDAVAQAWDMHAEI